MINGIGTTEDQHDRSNDYRQLFSDQYSMSAIFMKITSYNHIARKR